MSGGIALIIGMATVTIGGGITCKILEGQGKNTEAGWIDLGVKSLLALTAIGGFVKFISVLKTLG